MPSPRGGDPGASRSLCSPAWLDRTQAGVAPCQLQFPNCPGTEVRVGLAGSCFHLPAAQGPPGWDAPGASKRQLLGPDVMRYPEAVRTGREGKPPDPLGPEAADSIPCRQGMGSPHSCSGTDRGAPACPGIWGGAVHVLENPTARFRELAPDRCS